jgi:hypothetical protein
MGAMIATAAAGAITGRITAPSQPDPVAPAVQTVPNPAPGLLSPDDSPAEVHGRQIAR